MVAVTGEITTEARVGAAIFSGTVAMITVRLALTGDQPLTLRELVLI